MKYKTSLETGCLGDYPLGTSLNFKEKRKQKPNDGNSLTVFKTFCLKYVS